MKTYTLDDIRERTLTCYDPTRYLPDGWTGGTLLDILDVSECPPEDRLWVTLELLSERSRRLLACQFVRRTPLADGRVVWDLIPDKRSRNAVFVAERFAVGEATEDELAAAGDAAWAAARTAAGDAAWAAAKGAAWAATWAASRAAAGDATWDTSRAAAWAAQIEIAREFLLAI